MGTGIVNGLRAALLAAVACGVALPALADGMDRKGSLKDAPVEAPKRELQFSANVAATTDYVFRGFSQSAENPAWQTGVDVTYKWFYAGAWGSLIDFGRDGPFDVAHTEIDLYAGIKPVLGPVTLDLGVIYYVYPGARDGVGFTSRELDYVEIKFGASGSPWKDATLGGTVFYSPEYTNDTGPVWTFEGTLSQSFASIRDVTPSISGTIGYQVGDDIRYVGLIGNGADDYLYWNVGLGLGFGDRFSLDFRYWDTNISDVGNFCSGATFQCDERFVATAKVTY